MKKFRVISDLHVDVNYNHELKISDKNSIFTVIAGDVSGDPKITSDWINDNIKKGVFITGNHIVYNSHKKTLYDLKKELADNFGPVSNVTYLDYQFCTCKEVDGILFVGTTMYTDYQYGSSIERNMYNGERYLNDFRFGVSRFDENGSMVSLNARDYLNYFKDSIAVVENIISENEKLENPKPVVLITHHCLLKDCIDISYVDSIINSSYVSDYEWFLKKHPSIKCYICGHVHSRKTFNIDRDDGSTCLVVVNPRGYCHHFEDFNFNVNTFVDTTTWKVKMGRKVKSQNVKERLR